MAPAVQVHKDIPYLPAGSSGASERHLFDLYLPAACPGPVPLVVFMHASAWHFGDKSEFGNVATGLIEASANQLAVAVINYELSSRAADSVRHPDHLNSVAAAVRFLVTDQSYPGRSAVDTSQVHLMGHSAGAHLLMLLLVAPHAEFPHMDAVRSAVGIGGIYDIPGLLAAHPDYSDFVDLAFSASQHESASPRHVAQTARAGARHVRFLVVHSTTDEIMNIDQALDFAPQLVRAGYQDVTLAVRDLGPHITCVGEREFLRMAAAFVGHQPSA
ncbi:hypothetical protein IWQ56_001627 [Coemansia nantahalensis]|nr:hypothetical protein IWQ56_001627 [Coemansia nantahalensis]